MNTEIKIGTVANIVGKAYKVYNIIGDLVCFGRISKKGQMLSPKPHNIGAYTFTELNTYIEIGAIEIK